MANVISANDQENRVIIINLAISALANERQIDLNSLGIKVEELPEATKKLLREKIFQKPFLRAYDHLREQAETVVSSGGSTKTNLGAVTSYSEAVEKAKLLKDLRKQWDKRVEEDAARYDQMCADHIMAVSKEALKGGADPKQVNILVTAIKEKQPTWELVASKLNFSYTFTPVELEEQEFDPELFEAQRDSVVAIRAGVLGSLLQFVCGEAKEMLSNLEKQEGTKGTINLRVNPRTVSRARKMQAKLKSLAFIHPLIRPLHTEIASILDYVSENEALTGRDYLAFKEICLALRDQTLVHERLEKGLPLIHVATPSTTQVAVASASAQAATTTVSTPAAQAPAAAQAAQVTVSAQAAGGGQVVGAIQATATPSPAQASAADDDEEQAATTAPAVVEKTPKQVSFFL